MPNSENPSKHSLQVDISEDAIAEALRAVEGNDVQPDEAAVTVEVDGGAGDDAALRAELELKSRLLEQSAERMQQMMQRLQEANELRLRAVADLENYKKRAAREREEVQKFGVEKLLTELLPVLDNLDRALEAAGKTQDLPSFVEGVKMNRRLFEETLGRFGVQPFSAVGKPFDPHFHEALQQVESTEHPANVVVSEMVRGYMLHDRLVRPALVAVSAGPGPERKQDDAPGTTPKGEA